MESVAVSSNESIVEVNNDDENNGGEVMDSAESFDTNDSLFNETSHKRNKTYFYPKFVSNF